MIGGALRLVVAIVLLGGCTPSAPPPGASVTTILGGAVWVTFAGGRYSAFGAQSEPSDPPDGTLLVIPLEDIASVGRAVEADPVLFPDRTVFRIRNVNPSDAVVMFDRSTEEPEMLVLTRDGKSPTVVPGLCDYYADPTLQLCPGRVLGTLRPPPGRGSDLTTAGVQLSWPPAFSSRVRQRSGSAVP